MGTRVTVCALVAGKTIQLLLFALDTNNGELPSNSKVAG
jgi:hypothetical protein